MELRIQETGVEKRRHELEKNEVRKNVMKLEVKNSGVRK
tara:strand:+ start:312 stop:428 length:117 start_codon:yes stop_codon:yes gene_type:complete